MTSKYSKLHVDLYINKAICNCSHSPSTHTTVYFHITGNSPLLQTIMNSLKNVVEVSALQ